MKKKQASVKKPAPKAAVRVRALTLKQQLNMIRTFLNGTRGKELWDILAAMRGPDYHPDGISANDTLKENTSAVVRYAAFGDSAKAWTWPDSDTRAAYRRNIALPGPDHMPPQHFMSHMKTAFTALGLKWDENNKVKK